MWFKKFFRMLSIIQLTGGGGSRIS